MDYDKCLNPEVMAMKPSGIRRFFDIAETMADVVSLGVGEPDFATPWKIRAAAMNALENGNGVAWANDNTEVIAFANQNPGYTVGIPSLGSQDTIAPAVSKGNTTLLDWINDEITALADEQFFHKDYEETLEDTYGADYEDELVVEGGVTNA